MTTYDYNYRFQPITTEKTVAGAAQQGTAITYDRAGRKTTETTLDSSSRTDLVAAYSFNQSSGTTVSDYSGNDNDATISGATWTTSFSGH